MRIRFWGTRGSLPRTLNHESLLGVLGRLVEKAQNKGATSLNEFWQALQDGSLGSPLSYGGNTSCTEVTGGGASCYVDMGSGLREAGTRDLKEGRKEFHIFLTHMHWDHVMGLPFFVPIYQKGHTVHIYHVHRNAPEHVKICFNGVNFPVKWDQLSADMHFHQLKIYESTKVAGMSVTPFCLDHPGGSFGYRFEADKRALAIGVDGEYKRVTPAELGKDLPYYQNLDLLVFDAQYELEELAARFDFGHSSPQIGIDLALREGIKNLALTHHDPWSTEEKLYLSLERSQKHIASQYDVHRTLWDKLQPGGPRLFSAYDGLEINLDTL